MTWWITFNPSEGNWQEVLDAYKAIYKDKIDFEKTNVHQLINLDPGIFAVHFDSRVYSLFRILVQMGKDSPIGEITHFFHRREYQQRGAQHEHCFFWIKDAPKIGEVDDQVVIDFINQYITCKLPDPATEPEAFKIVQEFQTHKCNRKFIKGDKQ